MPRPLDDNSKRGNYSATFSYVFLAVLAYLLSREFPVRAVRIFAVAPGFLYYVRFYFLPNRRTIVTIYDFAMHSRVLFNSAPRTRRSSVLLGRFSFISRSLTMMAGTIARRYCLGTPYTFS